MNKFHLGNTNQSWKLTWKEKENRTWINMKPWNKNKFKTIKQILKKNVKQVYRTQNISIVIRNRAFLDKETIWRQKSWLKSQH